MRVIIFGATGSIGQQLISQALSAGHDVTAFVRNPEKNEQQHDKLQLIQGDVLDKEAVAAALPGHDAILIALGTPALTRNTVRSQGTANIVEAMVPGGSQRLICLTSLGIGDSRPTLPLHYKYILVPLLLRQAFADHERQEELVRTSGANWTIVRPGGFTDKLNGSYQHGRDIAAIPRNPKVSRAAVANFMLSQLETTEYAQATAWVSA